MSDQSQPIEQTPTGEIVDQSPTLTTETPKTETPPPAKPSIINEKTEEPKGAPEKYEDYKVPDGFQLDTEVAGEANTLFKEMGLSQSQGQKLVDFYIKHTQEALNSPYELWQETQQKWVDQVKADPDIGGKIQEVKTTVSRAIDGLGDPKLAADFRAAMDYTGAGNNLAFIKTFYKLAQRVTEGSHVSGAGPSAESQRRPGEGIPSAAKALFPNLP